MTQTRKRVLVSWGSKRGGTRGIAQIIARTLEESGYDVVALPASGVTDLSGYDAAVIGGALYANRWPPDVRRLVRRNVDRLRQIPTWTFSSGPLDDSADRRQLPPSPEVAALIERIGAVAHVTFGGFLAANAQGFPAAAMAKEYAGDYRNPARIRHWAMEVASAIPGARPALGIDHPGHSIPRLVGHAVLGWALCAALMGALLQIVETGTAIAVHAVAAPLLLTLVSVSYFRARGARDALATALAFTAIIAALDFFIVAGLIQRSHSMFQSSRELGCRCC